MTNQNCALPVFDLVSLIETSTNEDVIVIKVVQSLSKSPSLHSQNVFRI